MENKLKLMRVKIVVAIFVALLFLMMIIGSTSGYNSDVVLFLLEQQNSTQVIERVEPTTFVKHVVQDIASFTADDGGVEEDSGGSGRMDLDDDSVREFTDRLKVYDVATPSPMETALPYPPPLEEGYPAP